MTPNTPNIRRVVVIGAGGAMTRRFLKAAKGNLPPDLWLDLRDLSETAAKTTQEGLGVPSVVASGLDLFDDVALREAVRGARFVVHGAGPFHRTAEPVRRAALAAGATYMDIDDDVESTLAGQSLDAEARAAGVALLVGCGASPGLTNVLAADLASRLDSVEALDVAWCVGDEGPVELGRAVLGHSLHMGFGDYTGWRRGGPVPRPSFVATRRWPIPGLERHAFYECAHPEPVMLGRSHPGVQDITCWGALHPGPLNGLLRGIAEAEADGRIAYEAAIDFLRDVIAGKATDPAADALALEGVRAQRRRGEISLWDEAGFLPHALLKRSYPTQAATAAQASGLLDGRRVRLMRRIESHRRGSPLKVMEVATGCAEAAFFLEALERPAGELVGTLSPEQWVRPESFYRRLDSVLPPGAGDWLSPVLVQQGVSGPWCDLAT
ncbi:MAG: saccharopine dehydrogenase family protein [Phenylobacterium sp.]